MLEFKSTFSQALDNKVDNIIIEHKALQSVVGFLNNKNGGTLIIGIDDKMNVIGIEKDKFRENYDKFRRNFVQKVENLIGKSILDRINMELREYKYKKIFIVKCEARKKGSELVYLLSLKDKITKELYIRTEAKVVKLDGKELVDFVTEVNLEN